MFGKACDLATSAYKYSLSFKLIDKKKIQIGTKQVIFPLGLPRSYSQYS